MRVPYRLAGGDPAKRPNSDAPAPPTCALCRDALDDGSQVAQLFCPDAKLRDVHVECLRESLLHS